MNKNTTKIIEIKRVKCSIMTNGIVRKKVIIGNRSISVKGKRIC